MPVDSDPNFNIINPIDWDPDLGNSRCSDNFDHDSKSINIQHSKSGIRSSSEFDHECTYEIKGSGFFNPG